MKPDIWMNGRFVPWDEACIHPLCHSIQRGAALFESIDCNEAINGKAAIFRLPEHIHRFEVSAEIIGMQLPYSPEEISRAIVETVARSGIANCTIRPLAIYADPVMDLFPADLPVSIIIGLGTFHPSSGVYRLKVSGWRKIDQSCMPVKAKVSGNYIAPMLAKSEALAEGFNDAILLDKDGFVAEATTANIFIVEKGKLVTAPEDSILLGVTRDSIMGLSKHLGIGFIQEKFGPERLLNADEVILCSSGNEVKPVVQINNSVIGNGAEGPVTARLRKFYAEVIVGKVKEFERWLTYV
ncbi:MAG: branched-chain-amino-acid transaminase [Candidatus Latescibacterota bacterium]